jgi:hypothetical protein
MNTLKKLPLGSLNDGSHHENKQNSQKKPKISKTKSTIVNGFNQEVDFTKQRKSSLLIGGSKDD